MDALVKRLGLDSSNSSKPPSNDPNRKRGSKKNKSNRKPGGQKGHPGKTLEKISNPDKIETIKIDRRKLPRGNYKEVGYESRQVFDITISRVVTEYRAQILEDNLGNQYVASFPENVTNHTQYGCNLKADAVYFSQHQLIPYQRIQNYYTDQCNLPMSTGSIFNFNKEAFNLLEDFDELAKKNLINSPLINADETGINVNKKKTWLHCASNELWTYFYPHKNRGNKATDEIGILPLFNGVLCHDHWTPYYKYDCIHALCNSHHLRELKRAAEQDSQKWALAMRDLLKEMNRVVDEAGGLLSLEEDQKFRIKYRDILEQGKKECPLPEGTPIKKRGRVKKSKSRNLLERLIKFEGDTLRFMEIKFVPFTNNRGENDLRMTKVQQKISGCFRSMEGAYIFCRVRSYLSTCRKHGVGATEALRLLFNGKLPKFMDTS